MGVEQAGRVLVAGAGFSGAVIARELAEAGCAVDVADARRHVAGNCHTERDEETGVLVHRYGPHIFHTADEEVWRYVNRHDEFLPFVNRVKAVSRGRVYSLPVNLHTINQLFGRTMGPADLQTRSRNGALKAGRPPLPAGRYPAGAGRRECRRDAGPGRRARR